MAISLVFDVYSHVMSIFSLYLMFSQIDLLMIRMFADCAVTCFTTSEWMRNKTVDKHMHDIEGGLVDPPTVDMRRGGDSELYSLSPTLSSPFLTPTKGNCTPPPATLNGKSAVERIHRVARFVSWGPSSTSHGSQRPDPGPESMLPLLPDPYLPTRQRQQKQHEPPVGATPSEDKICPGCCCVVDISTTPGMQAGA